MRWSLLLISPFFFVFAASAPVNKQLAATERCMGAVKKAVEGKDPKAEILRDPNALYHDLSGIITTVKAVCEPADASETVDFLTENSGTITAIDDFMSDLTKDEFTQFTKMQQTNEFSNILKFVKNKADNAPNGEKSSYTSLMHMLVPGLLSQYNVSDTVLEFFNSISLDQVIKVVEAAEAKDLNALQRIVYPMIQKLKYTTAQRDEVLSFIRSLNSLHVKAKAQPASSQEKNV